jgi:hypothetical protein
MWRLLRKKNPPSLRKGDPISKHKESSWVSLGPKTRITVLARTISNLLVEYRERQRSQSREADTY